MQMAGLCTNRSVVVSGGGSAATGLGCRPRSPAVPASVSPLRNLRRLNCLACWGLIGISIPDTGQCDPKNAGQWTLLPSPEQAQHLTPRVRRGWKLKRRLGRPRARSLTRLFPRPPTEPCGTVSVLHGSPVGTIHRFRIQVSHPLTRLSYSTCGPSPCGWLSQPRTTTTTL